MTDLSSYIIGSLDVLDGYNGARADCYLACDPAGQFWAIPATDRNQHRTHAYRISDQHAAEFVVALR
jgi:hypothetical protein